GLGLVTLAVPEPMVLAALSLCPAATAIGLPLLPDGTLDASAAAERIDRALHSAATLIVGPGFGHGFAEQQVVVRLVAMDLVPLVLDADGLNALASLADSARDIRASMVITPHPGEFTRLASVFGITLSPTDPQTRPAAAAELARRLGCVVVLKGPGTIVSDGLRAWSNTTGNAALATGGTGDVLAGLIGGFVSQFAAIPFGALSLFDCARLAVRMHGLAADRWMAEHGNAGMTPSELLAMIPDVMAAERNTDRKRYTRCESP
ncbi:MAG: NAD(P)H-hydrate dehydratase, partial [Phycisphaerae bacterium]|nr:NAD(P)H-hydrate dehydratase [Phycisphaerae bacterium]